MREVFIKTPGGFRWPFSKGLLVESMMMAGLKMEPALSVAHTIEEQLKTRKKPEITALALKKLLIQEVEKNFGPELAERLRGQTQAFEDIVVKEGYRRRPFSKGVLARSLEDAGFSMREAQALARAVENRLRRSGVRSIEADELEKRITAEIEELFGPAARTRYAGRQALAGEIFVEEGVGEPRVPFSKGVLAQSVMAVGLSPDSAYRLARDVERRLRDAGSTVVTRDYLRKAVSEELLEEAGEEVARRYHLLRSIRRAVKPVHLLIGGVAGVGKSVLASALAYRLGITRMISTDAVREILRATIPKDLLPTLHTSSFDSWRALATPHTAEPTPAMVMQGFRDQVSRVAVGLRAIQERSAREKTSLVVEGVHVVPGYMTHQLQGEVIQIPIMLVLEDEALHRDRFALRERETRGSRTSGAYAQHFDQIRLIQQHLVELARGAGIPLIPAENLDRAIDKGLEVIVDRLQEAYFEAVQG
ncbi:MAG: 2-phosphoglycerate kinase [Meiothermus sp.]|uniref:ATP cone domain-containing protein n=1 Tax=Meiothermus sp. TaxID=1955249 RepID=UPI0025FFF9AF|nr:ATP cone domain-containing protein [Meiothermus sp.]MCS7069732.1 2-phosphoglycerate kinase [Meiothermus sp.]MCX7602001.1 2-phosphoglycerate kinase [Meiothermus sp.]MDW8426593.1 2-phosphoglycerate kinase [Meiothermus sp.]